MYAFWFGADVVDVLFVWCLGFYFVMLFVTYEGEDDVL